MFSYDTDFYYVPELNEALQERLVGRKIVDVSDDDMGVYTFTLDNGTQLTLEGWGDCCAWADISNVIVNLPLLDHIITSVTTEDGTCVHILAGMDEIVHLDVTWGEGSGYYAYGFFLNVSEVKST